MYRESKEFTADGSKHLCLIGWRKRTDDAERRGHFYPREQRDAGDWEMCAIGEAKRRGALIEQFNGKGMSGLWNWQLGRAWFPTDKELAALGMDFAYQVSVDDFDGCRDTINAIECHLKARASTT